VRRTAVRGFAALSITGTIVALSVACQQTGGAASVDDGGPDDATRKADATVEADANADANADADAAD
jgi:hypothetical protein